MSAAERPRHIGHLGEPALREIRVACLEELARGLAEGVPLPELQPVASLVRRVDGRLAAIAEEGPAPTIERRQEIAARSGLAGR